MLIDMHSHLDHAYFNEDIDKVIENARSAGVKVAIASGINPETNRKVLALAERFDIVKASLGIYPINTLRKEIEAGDFPLETNDFDVDEEIRFIEKNRDNIVYVGECGLDYSMVRDEAEQKALFSKMISLAEKIKKPILIHSRKAELGCIEMLESSSVKKIIMHCFSGKKSLVKRVRDNGWFLTIPTCVTRARQFQDIIKEVPLSQLFCETDAPYLSPFKDKRNEPAFIIESYKKIAEIKGMELNEVINNVWMNWQRLA
ncbi:TatD family hydrolase [Candidatus Woesearchaeota archaeon]|nr:TatD family hydrolase [Candidatus Woesearchaeota archaeon]